MDMLLSMDIRTMLLLLFWGNLTSLLLIRAYQLLSVRASDHQLVGSLVKAKIFEIIAYFCLALRGTLPDLLSVNLGNTCLFLGFYMEAVAIFQILQKEDSRSAKLTKGILLVFLFFFNLLELMFDINALRVPLASLVMFAIMLIPSCMLFLSRGVSRFKRIVGMFYFFFLSLQLPRTVYTLYNNVHVLSNNLIQSLTFLSMVMLMIFGLPSYLLLMKEETDKLINTMATTDCLTGLANRHSFLEAAQGMVEKCKNEGRSICVLFMDIDHFKRINDVYGHLFGDKVLESLSGIIRRNLRAGDLSCRYGGEEFLVLLSNAGLEAGRIAAQRIMTEISGTSYPQYPDFKFTISVGIADCVPRDNENVESFISKADKALYEAKNTGRNRIVEYSALNIAE